MFRHKCQNHTGPIALPDENGRMYRTCMRCQKRVLDLISSDEKTLSQEQLKARAQRAAASMPDFEPGVPKRMNPTEEVKPQNVVKMLRR